MGILSKTIADARPRAAVGLDGPAHFAPQPISAADVGDAPAAAPRLADGLEPAAPGPDRIAADPSTAGPSPGRAAADGPPGAAPDPTFEAQAAGDAGGDDPPARRAVEVGVFPLTPTAPAPVAPDTGMAPHSGEPAPDEPARSIAAGEPHIVAPAPVDEGRPVPVEVQAPGPDRLPPSPAAQRHVPNDPDFDHPPPAADAAIPPPDGPVDPVEAGDDPEIRSAPPVAPERPADAGVAPRHGGDDDSDAAEVTEVARHGPAAKQERSPVRPEPDAGPIQRPRSKRPRGLTGGRHVEAEPAHVPGSAPHAVDMTPSPVVESARSETMAEHSRGGSRLSGREAPTTPRAASAREPGRPEAPAAPASRDHATTMAAVPIPQQPQPPVPDRPARPPTLLTATPAPDQPQPSLYIGRIDVVIESAAPARETPPRAQTVPGPVDDVGRLYLKRL